MPSYTPQNILQSTVNGEITFFPSGSAFNATSSNASTAAQVDILVTSNLPENFVSDTVLNPYIQIPFISGSNNNGTDQNFTQ